MISAQIYELVVAWLVGPNIFFTSKYLNEKEYINSQGIWVQFGTKLISSKPFVPDILSPGVIVCNNNLPKGML